MVGNQMGGVLIGGSAAGNTIGGAQGTPNQLGTDSNVIAGNHGPGITVSSSATNNVISNDIVGLDQFGTSLPNSLPLREDLNGDGVSDLLMTNGITGGGLGPLHEVPFYWRRPVSLRADRRARPRMAIRGQRRLSRRRQPGRRADPDHLRDAMFLVAGDGGGTAQYTAIGGIGPEWQFEGNGPLLALVDTDDCLGRRSWPQCCAGQVARRGTPRSAGSGPRVQFRGSAIVAAGFLIGGFPGRCAARPDRGEDVNG